MKSLKVLLLFFLFVMALMPKTDTSVIHNGSRNLAEHVRAYTDNDYQQDWNHGEYNRPMDFIRDMTGIALIENQEDADPIEGYGAVARRGLVHDLEGEDIDVVEIPPGSLIWYGVHSYNYYRGQVAIYVGDEEGQKRVVSVVADGVMEKDIDWVWFGNAILGYTTPEQLYEGWGDRFQEYYNEEDEYLYTFLIGM